MLCLCMYVHVPVFHVYMYVQCTVRYVERSTFYLKNINKLYFIFYIRGASQKYVSVKTLTYLILITII